MEIGTVNGEKQGVGNNKKQSSSSNGRIQSKLQYGSQCPERIGVVEAPRGASRYILTADSTGQDKADRVETGGTKASPGDDGVDR